MEKKKIDIINNWNIKDVFNELEKGNMKIPRFQRGYVWERSKIVKLLNSIYEEHPIGTFFIWEASKEYSNYCRNIDELNLPEHPEADKFQFIIDGQQRITSLYVALKGKTLGNVDYSTICFNLDKKCFQIPRLKNEPNNIPAWKIFNTDTLMSLVVEYAAKDKEYALALQTCKKILDNYPVSIIKTLNVDLEEAVAIFENINQGGKRLTLFDLVHASVWSQDFDLREQIEAFNDSPAIKLFGGISEETFTQSLSLNAKGSCLKLNQLHLTNEDCKKYWSRTAECLQLAIDFVKEFGALRVDILPYEAMLPVLQYYYFVLGKSSMEISHKQLIADWFWSTTFSQRYSSSSLTRQKEDADWIFDIVAGAKTPRIFGITTTLKELLSTQMKHRSVIKNGVLCILAANTPVDFNNGQAVKIDNTNASRANAKENHHFFPFSRKKDFNIGENAVNSLLNFAFISKSLNLEISNKLPSQYLMEYENKSLDIQKWLLTHFIDEKAFRAAKNNNFNDFIEARGNLLLQKINELCHTSSGVENVITVDVDENTDLDNDVFEDEVDEKKSFGHHNVKNDISDKQVRFFCKNSKGANGTALFDGNNLYIQEGSECVLELTESGKKSSYIQPMRQKLLDDKVLSMQNGKLVFIKEYKFDTPSGGSSIILGYPSNGWNDWQDIEDRTLDEYYRK